MNKERVDYREKIEYDFDIVTIDDFKIPMSCTVQSPQFYCISRDNFKLFDHFFGGLITNFSFFRLVKFNVNPKII